MIIQEDTLVHYGTPRHSGRYPWGSGADPEQMHKSFLTDVDGMKKKGLSEVQIAQAMGITTTQLRARKTISINSQKQSKIRQAERLRATGMSNVAISREMHINESSVRALLAPGQKQKADVLQTTASMLRDQVAKKGLIDVGVGVEHHVGVARPKLNAAIAVLEEEGYKKHYVKVQQLGTGLNTTLQVLSAPGVSYSDVYKGRNNIKQITDFSEDGGGSFLGIEPPLQINSGRLAVRYAEQGGATADGVIYVRPGVSDISLGSSNYAQVRVAVDGTHYLKGMAMYKDDLPKGVDLMFNTNKSDTGKKMDALKPLKDDPESPFGSVVRQQIKVDSTGKKVVTSAMNLVNEEGDWTEWSRSLSSQMLSKQSPSLAKTQLALTQERMQNELNGISQLTNPAVRKKLLESFADGADAASVHLKAAALPRLASHVILPINELKDNEIYAPNYRNGERVVLIRHPHGGVFEIPELVVNNRNPAAKKAIGSATDAIGINSKVAERLSGADFDGDTVLVIPNNHGLVKTAPALAGLKNFDPKTAYAAYDGMKPMSPRTKQVEMGVVSNLITDMTIRGATTAELARAVRHSMVVIDAEKHNLDYKQSYIDNGIPQLKVKYQSTPGSTGRGASTLISRATSEIRIPNQKARPAADGGAIDKATGELKFVPTGESYTTKEGKLIIKTTKSKKLAETNDANTLSSGTPIEKIYADHSNKLKALANKARKEMVNTKTIPYSPSAKTAYSKEVASLNAALNLALRNAPLERQAQVVANAVVSQKVANNPNMEPSELKKIKYQALEAARTRTGAKKTQIQISDGEWAAIQAGAISNNKLKAILDNTDLESIKKLATPKSALTMTATKIGRATAMQNSGYTQAEIADALGVSVSTLRTALG